MIATATSVSPGFKGVITLELVNLGQVPIVLCPGVEIAQLIVSEVKAGDKLYSGKYRFSTGPEFSKIHTD